MATRPKIPKPAPPFRAARTEARTVAVRRMPSPSSEGELPTGDLVERGRQLGHRPSISTDGAISWSPSAVRRDIPNEKYAGSDAAAIEAFAQDLDSAVQKAAAAILTSPLLGAYGDFDGHTARWVELIAYYARESEDPGGLPTAFGYAVESLATGPLLPDPPSGMTIALQGSRGGTRPDLILIKSGSDVAWLDITASASAGHILDKAGAWEQIESYAEVTYPSLKSADYLAMAKAAASDPEAKLDFDGVDADAAFARAAEVKAAMEKKREAWSAKAQDLLAPVKEISVRGINSLSGPARRRERATKILADWLGIADLQQAVAASVIYALDLIAGTYGFLDSVSYGTGLAVLQDADPDVD